MHKHATAPPAPAAPTSRRPHLDLGLRVLGIHRLVCSRRGGDEGWAGWGGGDRYVSQGQRHWRCTSPLHASPPCMQGPPTLCRQLPSSCRAAATARAPARLNWSMAVRVASMAKSCSQQAGRAAQGLKPPAQLLPRPPPARRPPLGPHLLSVAGIVSERVTLELQGSEGNMLERLEL